MQPEANAVRVLFLNLKGLYPPQVLNSQASDELPPKSWRKTSSTASTVWNNNSALQRARCRRGCGNPISTTRFPILPDSVFKRIYTLKHGVWTQSRSGNKHLAAYSVSGNRVRQPKSPPAALGNVRQDYSDHARAMVLQDYAPTRRLSPQN